MQKALASRPPTFLISLEQELSVEYAFLLNQEEDFWALKSRVDWQLFGDRNTAYYHTKTIIKRKHNRIRRIMNQSGEWAEDEDQVMDIILSGYKELYQTQHLTSISTVDFEIEWAIALSDEDSRKLSVMPSNTEILKALSSLKPYKAPGVDGLHAGFFQHFWHIFEPSVIDEILTIFATKRIPSYLNHTLVTLILKRNGPEVLGHFRPISLYTTIYIMVSKIIVNRIKPHVQHLVSPLQVASIPGRKGA